MSQTPNWKTSEEKLDDIFSELDDQDMDFDEGQAIKYTACVAVGVILGFLAAAWYFAV